jgi:hypothetical protein
VDIAEVDQREVGHALLELAETGADKFLSLLGHVVLGVLAEVTHGDGLLELLGKLVIQLMFQDLDLVFQFLFDLFRHAAPLALGDININPLPPGAVMESIRGSSGSLWRPGIISPPRYTEAGVAPVVVQN